MGACLSCCPDNVRDYCLFGDTPVPKNDKGKNKKERKFIGFADTLAVWNTTHQRGIMTAVCPICETNTMILENRKGKKGSDGKIDYTGVWEIGHIKAHAEGGNEELDNLRPICKPCNRAMGKMHMVEYCKRNVPVDRLNATLTKLKLNETLR
jgi:hypothetical protein